MTKSKMAISIAPTLLILLVVYSAVTGGETQGDARVVAAPGTEQAKGSPASSEQLKWQIISSGGTDGSSASYSLKGTVAQVATDCGSSASYTLRHGFWQQFASSGVECEPGDANGSGGDPAVDIDDVVYLIAYIFSGGPAPVPDLCCGDANGSGGDPSVDIDDVVYLIAYIFSGGPPPVDAC